MKNGAGWRTEIVMNAAMSVSMSLSAALLHGEIGWGILPMTLLGFAVGMVLSFLLPYDRMSAGMCRCLRVKAETEEKKFVAGLVGTLPPAVIQTVVISAVMTAIQLLPHNHELQNYLHAYGKTTLVLSPIAYVTALLVRPLAARWGSGQGDKKENGR